MGFEECKSVDNFLELYPNCFITDFSQNRLECTKTTPSQILIGSEGGFSLRERGLFKEENVFGFDTKLILRSESAVTAVCSKILL